MDKDLGKDPVVETSELKKYIRTLAGDIAMLKGGGTPDLTLFEKPKPKPKSEEDSSVSIPPKQIPEFEIDTSREPIPTRKDEPVPLPSQRPVQAALPPPPNPPPPPVLTPKPKPRFESVSPLETYAGDFLYKMRDTKASTATVLATEQDNAAKAHKTAQKSSHSILYISVGVLLLIAGASGVYIAYTSNSIEPAIILAPTIQTPIPVGEREEISGTGIALLQSIEQSISNPPAPGVVRLLYSVNATTTGNSIFSALQLPAPDVLLRNINASGSMVGILDAQPFFILSVASYGQTFAGMLSWEPVMARDLKTLFQSYLPAQSIVIAPIATSTLTTTKSKNATTTTATQSAPVFIAGFRDEVINSHDARVYRDSNGRSILLYGYWNQKILVIARDPAAFTDIINRLASAHTQ